VLKLDYNDASLVIMPEAGGAIVGWTREGTHLLRRAHPDAILSGNVRGLGCFPMVPFCNRIADGHFVWRGVSYQLERSFGDQRHALHGVGLQRSWQVVGASRDQIVLTLDHDAGGASAGQWPFPFSATLSYQFHSHLTVTLSVMNRHTEPAPMGIGLHPYFPHPPGATLQFGADGVWLNGDEPLPKQHATVPPDWDHSNGLTIGRVRLDNCFTGWNRRALISGIGDGITIEADAAFRHLQVFTPPGQDFFCVEPVSHVPNALNLPDLPADQVMHIMEPGAVLSGTITIG
jgi:aldose 1-epimerase